MYVNFKYYFFLFSLPSLTHHTISKMECFRSNWFILTLLEVLLETFPFFQKAFMLSIEQELGHFKVGTLSEWLKLHHNAIHSLNSEQTMLNLKRRTLVNNLIILFPRTCFICIHIRLSYGIRAWFVLNIIDWTCDNILVYKKWVHALH